MMAGPNHGWCFLTILLLLGLIFCLSDGKVRRIRKIRQDHIPRVSFLKRQLSGFTGVDGNASIVIVYQTEYDTEVDVRWFKTVQPEYLPEAEFPHMIITGGGDDGFTVMDMSAGTVKATKLIITNPETAFPVKFTTSFSVKDYPMQYHLDTIITKPVNFKLQMLDSVTWQLTPPRAMSYRTLGKVNMVCVALLDSESESEHNIDELSMYKSSFRKVPNEGEEVYTSIGIISRDRKNYNEESLNHKQEGKREVLPFMYYRYKLAFRVKNATADEQGMYACAMERRYDRTYVSSWVQLGQLEAPPVLEFIACEANAYDVTLQTLFMSNDRATCFRCRAYGFPEPKVTISKVLEGRNDDYADESKWDKVVTTGEGYVDSQINVSDGGWVEVTYTIWRPSADRENGQGGRYKCAASNAVGRDKFLFSVVVLPP